MSLALLDSFLDKGRNSYQTPGARGQKHSPGQRCDTRSLDTGSLTKGKKKKTQPSEFTHTLEWKQAAKNCARIREHYSVETEISSDIPLENRRSGFSKRETVLLLLESERERAAKGLDRLARLNKPHFFGCCWNLPLLLKPWLWYALHAEEIGVGQERWRGKGNAQRDRKGKGLLCSRNPCLPHPSWKGSFSQTYLSVSDLPFKIMMLFDFIHSCWRLCLNINSRVFQKELKKIQIKKKK